MFVILTVKSRTLNGMYYLNQKTKGYKSKYNVTLTARARLNFPSSCHTTRVDMSKALQCKEDDETKIEVEMITQETNPVIISLYFTLEP